MQEQVLRSFFLLQYPFDRKSLSFKGKMLLTLNHHLKKIVGVTSKEGFGGLVSAKPSFGITINEAGVSPPGPIEDLSLY